MAWAWVKNTLYNLDRTVASLFGASPQETISSWLGRESRKPGTDPTDVACEILDAIDHGHCEHAVTHADKLKQADDGFTG